MRDAADVDGLFAVEDAIPGVVDAVALAEPWLVLQVLADAHHFGCIKGLAGNLMALGTSRVFRTGSVAEAFS